MDLKRCDICGCVHSLESMSYCWYFEGDWVEYDHYGHTEDYCPECAKKVNEAIAKIKKELE